MLMSVTVFLRVRPPRPPPADPKGHPSKVCRSVCVFLPPSSSEGWAIQGMLGAIPAAGAAAASVLEMITPYVVPGVTTAALNARCHRFIVEALSCIPAPLNYRGAPGQTPFPASVCPSVNHVVCHGIPTEGKALQRGDLLTFDVTVIKDGR